MPNHRIHRLIGLASVLPLLAVLAACEVEWEGAEVTVERPVTPADTATGPPAGEPELPDLPTDPLLYRVRVGTGGEVLATPLAALRGDGLDTLELPEDVPESWWRRFDSTFLAPGRELELHAGGTRLGSLVIGEIAEPSGPRCPGTSSGRLLLPPGSPVPTTAFALPRSGPAGAARTPAAPAEASDRTDVFGPILAERLLQEAGVEQHFLAQETDLRPVSLGESDPGMAATYLIRDSLAPGAPEGEAVSLFYLARAEPGEGYVVDWSRVARYGTAEEKEVYRHVESLRLASGRVDVLRRYDGTGTRLVAAWADGEGGEREIHWTESGLCTSEPE